MQNAIKILIFAALIFGFFMFAGHISFGHDFRPVRLAEGRAIGCFVIGAWISVWGDKQVGTLDPISLRSMFVILGVLLMIWGCILIYAFQKSSA